MAYLSLQQYLRCSGDIFIEVLKDREKKGRTERSLKLITINGGDSLTEDLIIEIFSWLPVKTLLQFKSLCKSWYTIITKPEFVSKHLENYYNNNHAMNCFLTLTEVLRHTGEVDLSGWFVDEALENYVSASFLRIRPLGHEFEIDGPCNGIYVVNNSWSPKMHALWNPTINEFNVLPPVVMKPDLPTNLTYCRDFDTYGIGFDPLAKDYKVAVIKRYTCKLEGNKCYCNQSHHPLSVLVYSSRANSWKYWGDLRECYDIVERNLCYIFVNGCFYWIATAMDGEFEQIIEFDIIAESLQEIQVPNYEKPAERSLGVYYDSIAIYSVNPNLDQDDKYFDIWSFNEGCWTKKVTIGPLLAGYWYPLGTLKNDKAVLLHGKKLVLCDPDTKQMCDIAECIYWDTSIPKSVVVYMESLVSVKDLASKSAT